MQFEFKLTSAELGTSIVDDPMGWADLSLELKRHPDWHGQFYDYTLPLKFALSGYDYLKTIYDLKGPFAICDLIISQRLTQYDAWEVLYTGRMNFAKYRQVAGKAKIIEIPIDPTGSIMKLRNKYEEKVEMASDGFVYVTPKTILKVATFHEEAGDDTVIDAVLPYGVANGSALGTYQKTAISIAGDTIDFQDNPLEFESDYSIQNIGSGNGTPYTIPNYPNIPTNLFIAPVNGTYKFEFNLDAAIKVEAILGGNTRTTDTSGSDKFRNLWIEPRFSVTGSMNYIVSDGVNDYPYVAGTNTGIVTKNFQFTRSDVMGNAITLNLVAGDKVNCYFAVSHGSKYAKINIAQPFNDVTLVHRVVIKQGSQFKVTLNDASIYPTTGCAAVPIDECFDRAIKGITNNELVLKSEYFGRTDGLLNPETGAHYLVDGPAGLRCLANGKALRQYSNSPLFLSLKQLFDNISAIDNIGMAVKDNHVVIEEMAYFYNHHAILKFDNVESMGTQFDESMIVNKLSIGYSKWESEMYNGLDEFCTKREYSNLIDFSRGELNKICEFIAAGYAIEVTRREAFTGTSSKDWQYDSDTFIMCLKRISGAYYIETGNVGSAANLIDPSTVFNWRISPARNAIRWLRRMLTGYKDLTPAMLKFTFGDGNYHASGTQTGGHAVESGVLAENQNIVSATVGGPTWFNPIFSGETVPFEIPLTKDQYQTLKSDATNGIGVRRIDSDEWVYGWVKNLSYKPARQTAKFDLIKAYNQSETLWNS